MRSRTGSTVETMSDRRLPEPWAPTGDDEDVSPQVAADMLGISLPHLNGMLERKTVPHRHVGDERRIKVADIEAFRLRRERRRESLKTIASIEADK